MMFLKKYCVTLWLLFLLPLACCNTQPSGKLPASFQAKVIGVMDGDTIEVLYENKPIRIRLAHIDCPEIRNGQPFGRDAKKFTSDLCFGQDATIYSDGTYDRYKRLIAVIFNEKNVNVNKSLVEAGLAWHYTKYSFDESYTLLERTARQKRSGIWREENPIPPWEWRKKSGSKKLKKATGVEQ